MLYSCYKTWLALITTTLDIINNSFHVFVICVNAHETMYYGDKHVLYIVLNVGYNNNHSISACL